MDDTVLSWYQALQFIALGPCLFMIFFLLVAGRNTSQIVVPILYFISLACSFLLPVSELFAQNIPTHLALLIGTSAAPALSFLLIVQFMQGSVPKIGYWAILAVPLLGSSQIIYATLVTDAEICFYNQLCAAPQTLRKLYDIFSISLTCLLTLAMYRRINRVAGTPWENRQKYALVMALVVLNLALLGIDLMQIHGTADIQHARIAKTFVRIGFIYLALTSVFRVFDRSVEIDYASVPSIRPAGPSERDKALAQRISALFDGEKLHRETELNREKLARMLAVNEGVLSRVVNQCFQENVSMLINQYRITEAKERLAWESTAITVIAFEVGFSSIPSFNRVFRQLTDMSPSEYRQRQTIAASKG